MQTLSIVSAAWIIVGGSSDFVRTGCMESGVEYGPTHSGSSFVNTIASFDTDGPWQDCEHLCEEEPECSYFTWTGPSCSLYKEERDKHWPKSIVHRVAVENEGDCARVCGLDPECNAGFTYHKQTCTTKRSNGPRVVGKTWYKTISGPVECPEGATGVVPAAGVGESEPNCPEGYEERSEFCYRVSFSRLTQPEAEAECGKVPGGHLAMPKTESQNKDLLSLFCSMYPEDVGQGPFKVETTAEKLRKAKEKREEREDRILVIKRLLREIEQSQTAQGMEGDGEGMEGNSEGMEGDDHGMEGIDELSEEDELRKQNLLSELSELESVEEVAVESSYECEIPRGAGLDGPYFIGLVAQGQPGVDLDAGKWQWTDGDWLIPPGQTADTSFHRWAGQANNTPIFYGGYPTVQPDNTSKKQFCAYFYPRNTDGSPVANWGDEDCEHKCLYPAQDVRGPMQTCYTKGSEGYAVEGQDGAAAYKEGGSVGKLTPTPRRYICQAPKRDSTTSTESHIKEVTQTPPPLTAAIFQRQCSFVGVYLDTDDLQVVPEVKSIVTCQKACLAKSDCAGYSFLFFPKRSERLSTAANRRAGFGYCYLKSSLDNPTLTTSYDVMSVSRECKLK